MPWLGLSLGCLVDLLLGGYLGYQVVAGRDNTLAPRDAAYEERRLAYSSGDTTDEAPVSRRLAATEARWTGRGEASAPQPLNGSPTRLP